MNTITVPQLLSCMTASAFEDIINANRDILKVAEKIIDQMNTQTSLVVIEERLEQLFLFKPWGEQIIFTVSKEGKIIGLQFRS